MLPVVVGTTTADGKGLAGSVELPPHKRDVSDGNAPADGGMSTHRPQTAGSLASSSRRGSVDRDTAVSRVSILKKELEVTFSI